jgi:hypothetical protein
MPIGDPPNEGKHCPIRQADTREIIQHTVFVQHTAEPSLCFALLRVNAWNDHNRQQDLLLFRHHR